MSTLHRIFIAISLATVPLGIGCEDDSDGTAPGETMTGDDTPPDDTPTAGSSSEPPAQPADIVATAVAAGSFTQLAQALTMAGLVEALQGEGPFTVFAPTDEAFEAFEQANPGVLQGLGVEALTEILTYHVVSGAAVMSTDLQDGQLAQTLAGPMLAVDLDSGVKVNEATVVMADIEATNGVIHVIDRILLPPGDLIEVATAAGGFTALAGALSDAGLVETLRGEGPFTVFAPTDEAFAALSAVPSGDALENVLLYHVLPGIAGQLDLVNGGAAVTASGSPVLFDLSDGAKILGGGNSMASLRATNVVAKNGVIHVIDAVILPPENDLVDTAVAAGSFTTLASALSSQNLVDTLKGQGPFTVFAPTDEAFAALSAVPSGDALTDVLLYHVTEGAVGSGNLEDGAVEMLSGDSTTVSLSAGVKVDASSVTAANILARNGIIHVIDAVLVP